MIGLLVSSFITKRDGWETSFFQGQSFYITPILLLWWTPCQKSKKIGSMAEERELHAGPLKVSFRVWKRPFKNSREQDSIFSHILSRVNPHTCEENFRLGGWIKHLSTYIVTGSDMYFPILMKWIIHVYLYMVTSAIYTHKCVTDWSSTNASRS